MTAAASRLQAPDDPLHAPLLAGDRRALARAITLVESTREDHRRRSDALLAALLPRTGRSTRLGITGIPGVGKSTFIERFGLELIGQGRRVAVLAVDPSSKRTGGSILGDKTRMELLARDPNAFIRPSPSGGTLGGVARRTREAMLLVEAAGYDVVLVETVGVGQSETSVADMVDMFLLLLAPGGGDELQGIKRGIMELADLIVVNKADGDLVPAARRAQVEYQAALHLMRPKNAGWTPHVLLASALKGEGLGKVWEAAEAHRKVLAETGDLSRLRAAQAKAWFWTELREGLFSALKSDRQAAALVPELEREVAEGQTTPTAAARRLLGLVLGRSNGA